MLLNILFYAVLIFCLPMIVYVVFLVSSRAWTSIGISIWTRILEHENSRDQKDEQKIKEVESMLIDLEFSKEFINALGEYYQERLPDIMFDLHESWKTIKNAPLIGKYVYSIALGYLYLLKLKIKG